MESESLDTLTFEQALGELEQLVGALEKGDLELERALDSYERGVRLARHCIGRLNDAELRVKELAFDPSEEE